MEAKAQMGKARNAPLFMNFFELLGYRFAPPLKLRRCTLLREARLYETPIQIEGRYLGQASGRAVHAMQARTLRTEGGCNPAKRGARLIGRSVRL